MVSAPAWLDRREWPYEGKTCALADGTVHYVDEGHGTPVVLVHGTPTWGFEWRHVVAALRDSHRVIVPDHLGFGLSSRPADADYSPEAHAARFAEFMTRVLPEGRVSLVVHDFGGPIALAWALAHADRLASLTLVNTWMWSFADDPTMWRRAGLVDNAFGRLLYRHANASLRLVMPSAYGDKRRLTREIHRQYLAAFPDADSRERVLFALVRALRGSSALYAGLWSRRAALSQVPMAIVWGMRDSAFLPTNLERWVAAFPHAAVTRVDDAGHWPHEEAPATVIAALRARLADVV
jgi:haloalkane dehalogenase